MKVAELVQAASASNARVFEKIDPKTANAIASALMAEIGDQIDSVNDGRVTIAGLGSFVIKQVDAPKLGAGAKQKRVLLRRPQKK